MKKIDTAEQGDLIENNSPTAIDTFLSNIIDPHTEKINSSYSKFEEKAEKCLKELDEISKTEEEQKIVKLEQINFKTLLDRWKRKLNKKYEKLNDSLTEFKTKCKNDINSELKKVIGKIQGKTLSEALLNPCSQPICKRNAKEKLKLELENAKLSSEYENLKKEFDTMSLKASSSIRMRDESKNEVQKIQSEFQKLKDSIIDYEEKIRIQNEEFIKTRKENEQNLEKILTNCVINENRANALLAENNKLYKEINEKTDYIKALEGNFALLKSDHDILISKYNELLKKLLEIQEKAKNYNEKIPLENRLILPELNLLDNESKPQLIEARKIAYAINPCRKWMQNIKELLQCPITETEIKDPVVCSDGHTYEKEVISAWMKTKKTSPVTREIISMEMYKNYAVKKVIDLIKTVENEENLTNLTKN